MQDNNRPVPPEGYLLRYDTATGQPVFVKAEQVAAEEAQRARQREQCPPQTGSVAPDSARPAKAAELPAPCGPLAVGAGEVPALAVTAGPRLTGAAVNPAPPVPLPPSAPPKAQEDGERSVRPDQCAGFFTRLAAYLFDAVAAWLMALVVGLLLKAVSAALGGALEQPVFFRFDVIDIVRYLVKVSYFILLTGLTGWTLGKRLLRIRVVAANGGQLRWRDVIYRETVGRYLSSLLCIGYIVLALDRRHRGFHDMLCDTRVVYLETAEALS